jgi:hypothetical protein
MAAQAYGTFATRMAKGEVDFDTATVKCLLVGAGYTQNIDTHDFLDDITSEMTGTGYTAGGVTVSGVAVTYDSANNRAMVDCTDVAFGTVTLTSVAGAVFYLSTGVSSTSLLVAFMSWTPVSVTGAAFTLVVHANGLVTVGV